MEIKAGTLSSSIITKGEKTDLSWFDKLKSEVSRWFGTPKTSASDIKKAVKESWGDKLGKAYGALKNSIKSLLGKAVQGNIPLSEELYGILKWGDDNLAAIQGAGAGVAAVTGAVALNATTGVTVPEMVEGLLNFGEVAWEFNWNVSDKELWDQIKGLIDSLYGQAGEFIGSNIARLLVGGVSTPPKITVNMRSLALSWMILDESDAEAMLQSVSTFAWQGIYVAKEIMFKFSFIKGREAIKKLYEGNKEMFKQLYPDLAKVIPNWGKEGAEEWSISGWVEKKVESLDDKRIQDFVRGAMSGFWNEFRNSVEKRFDR
ncbi:hypothetical protein [Planktothrix sp.]|uniref:hypothetical protein n=2 Tax=Planktothrix sp. TaxID=3088171 RepID=UPI0038D4D3F8